MRQIIFGLLIFLIGCESADFLGDQSHGIESGNYSDIFIFSEKGNVREGKMRFTFTNNNYSCDPELQWLPSAGGGKYEIINHKIILTDLLNHTADFDWSLILNGEFLFIEKSEAIILIQKDKKRDRKRYI